MAFATYNQATLLFNSRTLYISLSMHPIRIALLICDPVLDTFGLIYGDYHVLFSSLLTRSLPPGIGKEAFVLDAYDVFKKMEYPPDEAEGYDALLISGSRESLISATTSSCLASPEVGVLSRTDVNVNWSG